MVAVTGRTCYDRIRIFEVKRYFLIDITESRGQIMQKNYVQEILNIIHADRLSMILTLPNFVLFMRREGICFCVVQYNKQKFIVRK